MVLGEFVGDDVELRAVARQTGNEKDRWTGATDLIVDFDRCVRLSRHCFLRLVTSGVELCAARVSKAWSFSDERRSLLPSSPISRRRGAVTRLVSHAPTTQRSRSKPISLFQTTG